MPDLFATSVFPVPMPPLLRLSTPGLRLATEHGETYMTSTLRTKEEVVEAFGWIAGEIAQGAPGTMRVSAVTLARLVGMKAEWDALCRERGLKVL